VKTREQILEKQRANSKARRAELAGDGWCLNNRAHGLATHGKLCRKCRAKHRKVPLEMVSEVIPRPPATATEVQEFVYESDLEDAFVAINVRVRGAA